MLHICQLSLKMQGRPLFSSNCNVNSYHRILIVFTHLFKSSQFRCANISSYHEILRLGVIKITMNEDRHIGTQSFRPLTFKTYHLNTGQSGNLSPPISCKTIRQHSLGRWWSLYSVGMSNKSTAYESLLGWYGSNSVTSPLMAPSILHSTRQSWK